jgi:hypothetical protein
LDVVCATEPEPAGLVETGLADRFDEQDRPGPGHDLAAVVLDADARVGPDRELHLECALFQAANRTLRQVLPSQVKGTFSVFLINLRTAHLMKA